MALDAGLPTACEWAFMAREGCMLAYGPAREAAYRRVAGQLARVLSGTLPAEIPVEQPAEFEFAVNLRTARRLGVEVPPSVLVRADEVIE
jgi:putative tryptophan/tyrosine transport system substrate-binding protein